MRLEVDINYESHLLVNSASKSVFQNSKNLRKHLQHFAPFSPLVDRSTPSWSVYDTTPGLSWVWSWDWRRPWPWASRWRRRRSSWTACSGRYPRGSPYLTGRYVPRSEIPGHFKMDLRDARRNITRFMNIHILKYSYAIVIMNIHYAYGYSLWILIMRMNMVIEGRLRKAFKPHHIPEIRLRKRFKTANLSRVSIRVSSACLETRLRFTVLHCLSALISNMRCDLFKSRLKTRLKCFE